MSSALEEQHMDRRTFLAVSSSTTALAISGCSEDDPETEGDDNNPIDAEPEALLPSADLFGNGWEQQDDGVAGLHQVELEGDTASVSFITDNAREGVNVEVTVFNSVNEAIPGYQEMREADPENSTDEVTVEDVEIASEGYLIDIGGVVVYFRDANVIGALGHVLADESSSSNSGEYAADWHETWRD